MKKVSVIIPCYNVASYIRQCLNSVINQTYRDIEIIVVNDGSTDDTYKIIEEYRIRDNRIIVINKKNGGLASARNGGLRVSTGEYIVLFDSDDVMIPNKIEKQVAWMEENKYEISYSNTYHFLDNTEKVYKLEIEELGDDQYDSLVSGNKINPNTVCMSRNLYEKVGLFDESLLSAEDWDYWLRVNNHDFLFTKQNDYLTLYRIRTNSLSSDRVTMYQTAIRVLEKQLELEGNKKYIDKIKQRISRYTLKLKIETYLKNGMKNTTPLKLFYTFAKHILSSLLEIKLKNKMEQVGDIGVIEVLRKTQNE